MIRNLIWDVDGTLFDTYPAMSRAFQAALSDVGVSASVGWIETLARESLGHCVSTLSEHYHLSEEEVTEGFRTHYVRVPPEEQPPFPGVAAVCEYVCSIEGKNVIVTHRGRTTTEALLAANNMVGYFAGCLTRDDGYPRKPDPAAFEAALDQHGMKREETMAVGDREIDISAGQAAGVLTCLFAPHPRGSSADLVIRGYDELQQHLVFANRKPSR